MAIFSLLAFGMLYFLSRRCTQKTYELVYLVTGSRKFGISILALLFFPGTIVHELSHWLIAEFLRVKTGEIVVHPIILKDGSVRMGSVEIARVDPFRRMLVGLSPLLLGGLLLIAGTNVYVTRIGSNSSCPVYTHLNSPLTNIRLVESLARPGCLSVFFSPLTLLYLYGIFVVGNTMFSSKRDLEGFIPMAIILLLASGLLYVAHLFPDLSFFKNSFDKLTFFLFWPLLLTIILDLVFLLFLGILTRGTEKIVRRRIVHT